MQLQLAGGYMRKSKGFALVQAMLFMMFVAAAISISMVVKVNDSATTAPADSAVETFPAVQGFITYALAQVEANDNVDTVSSSGANGYSETYLGNDYKTSLDETVFNTASMTVTVDEQYA